MAVDVQCKVLCKMQWDERESAKVANRIEHEYFVHLITDNLPVATQFMIPESEEKQYEPGFRLGFSKDRKVEDGDLDVIRGAFRGHFHPLLSFRWQSITTSSSF